MISYAGIGSRDISDEERETIIDLSKTLSSRFVVYSGNADGSDIAFQIGSKGKCVIFLPWLSFNKNNYDPVKSLSYFDTGSTSEGLESVSKFHPAPQSLSHGARRMMCRNYHQIMGYKEYPRVSFVVCCAKTDKKDNVMGGTGQACRIAKSLGIPVINIRKERWKRELIEVVKGCL